MLLILESLWKSVLAIIPFHYTEMLLMLASHLVDCILTIPAQARVLLQIPLQKRFHRFCIQSNRTFLFFYF
jgi:hypothetical protein